jgi:hypothetical protein
LLLCLLAADIIERQQDVLERAVIHEAAHAVACIVLGLPIATVTIAAGHPHLRRGYYRQQRDIAIEALAIMSLAGAEAERLFFPGDSDDDYGDAGDLKMVRSYLEPRTKLAFIGEIARFRLAAQRRSQHRAVRSRPSLQHC